MRIGHLLILSLFFWQCQKNETSPHTHTLNDSIESIAKHFVKDKRTARFEVQATAANGQYILSGETTTAAAKDSLINLLQQAAIPFIDSINVWPLASLGQNTFALAKHSVINLRSKAGHSQELATQVLLGTPLKLLKKEKEWYFVQCPDEYLAWVHEGELHTLSPTQLKTWNRSERLIFIADYGHSFFDQTQNNICSDLVNGDILQLIEQKGKWTKVAYPDGRMAFVNSELLMPLATYLNENTLSFERTLTIAKQQIGKPYLWGGTSPKGMDCSGFTKTVYRQQGLIIPRDASQQIQAGQIVTYNEQLEGLIAGDFLFFGRYRDDGSEKITHVGIYLGDGQFIHSGSDNGANAIQNLLAHKENYVEHRRKSLLQARRMTPQSDHIMAIKAHPWYWE